MVTPSLISASWVTCSLDPAIPLWQLSRMMILFFAGDLLAKDITSLRARPSCPSAQSLAHRNPPVLSM